MHPAHLPHGESGGVEGQTWELSGVAEPTEESLPRRRSSRDTQASAVLHWAWPQLPLAQPTCPIPEPLSSSNLAMPSPTVAFLQMGKLSLGEVHTTFPRLHDQYVAESL